VVSCRVCAPEIRRDFSRQGAVGISATSPERNPVVSRPARSGESPYDRLAPGASVIIGRPPEENPLFRSLYVWLFLEIRNGCFRLPSGTLATSGRELIASGSPRGSV